VEISSGTFRAVSRNLKLGGIDKCLGGVVSKLGGSLLFLGGVKISIVTLFVLHVNRNQPKYDYTHVFQPHVLVSLTTSVATIPLFYI